MRKEMQKKIDVQFFFMIKVHTLVERWSVFYDLKFGVDVVSTPTHTEKVEICKF